METNVASHGNDEQVAKTPLAVRQARKEPIRQSLASEADQDLIGYDLVFSFAYYLYANYMPKNYRCPGILLRMSKIRHSELFWLKKIFIWMCYCQKLRASSATTGL